MRSASYQVDSKSGGDRRVLLSDERMPRQLLVVWVLVIVSLLAWRSGVYYSGGIDPIVMAKALLGSMALGLALHAYSSRASEWLLGSRSLFLTAAYCVVTVLGGWAAGDLLPSAILAARVMMVAVTVALCVATFGVRDSLRSGVAALSGIGIVCGLSGVSSLAHGERLSGTVIPLNPNQLALLLGPATIWLVWRLTRSRVHLLRNAGLLTLLLGMTWLTGSRTGLIALALGVIVVIVRAPRLPLGGFIALALATPVAFYVVAFTPILDTYIHRNGTGKVTTLNSRTVAWSAAFNQPLDFWQHWFGGGLVVKTVAVSGTYWDTQVLDSSWVSAFVQGGLFGTLLMGLWVVTAFVTAAAAPARFRALIVALMVYAVVRSTLENGLIDTYVLFLTMLIPAMSGELRGQPEEVEPCIAADAVHGSNHPRIPAEQG